MYGEIRLTPANTSLASQSHLKRNCAMETSIVMVHADSTKQKNSSETERVMDRFFEYLSKLVEVVLCQATRMQMELDSASANRMRLLQLR